MRDHGSLQSSELARTAQDHIELSTRPAPLNRRFSAALAGAAALAGVAVAFPAGASPVGAWSPTGLDHAYPATKAQAADDWTDAFIEILRELIIILGGNPEEIDERLPPEINMGTVANRYSSAGAPTTLTSEEKLEAVADIDRADALAAGAPSDVDSAAVSEFRAMLSAFRSDLTALPPAPQPPVPRGM